MKSSLKVGLSFGLTSGIITTLGLMVGLATGTDSKLVVTGGIITIAVADAMSDALGMHLSQEATHRSHKQVWESTFATFLSKFIFALTFVVPVLLFPLIPAVVVSVIWGMLLLGILSHLIANQEKEQPWKFVVEHWSIAILVIVSTYAVGGLVKTFIG